MACAAWEGEGGGRAVETFDPHLGAATWMRLLRCTVAGARTRLQCSAAHTPEALPAAMLQGTQVGLFSPTGVRLTSWTTRTRPTRRCRPPSETPLHWCYGASVTSLARWREHN